MNIVVLQGMLSSEPVERTLSDGRNVMDWVVATETTEGRSTVPVQWNEPNKRIRGLEEGDEVVVVGHVRTRFFRVGGATVARAEVVASGAARPTQAATVTRLLAQARHGLPT